MSSGIFLINKNDELIELTESQFENEDIFQKLLEKYPNLLSGQLIDSEEPRSWVLIDREVGIPGEESGGNRWSLDHLFLDQDGIPTLVEVKRSTDTRVRREVVGQMLDYAANAITYWPMEQIISLYEERCDSLGEDPEQLISNRFDQVYDSYWEQVKTNLRAGKIRMIFLADKIPVELKRIVEFLNEQMDPATVLALEIKQYKSDGLQTLVPSIYGNTSEAEKRKSGSYSSRDPWTRDEVFSAIEENAGESEARIAEKILEWADQHATRIYYGKGKTVGSAVPIWERGENKQQLFRIDTRGKLELYFQYHANKKPFDDIEKRKTLLKKLNKLDGVNLSESVLDRRPHIPLSRLEGSQNLETFFTIYEWFLQEVQKSQN